MNLKKLLLAIVFLMPILAIGQATSPNDFKCGITAETAAAIKERLMDNRRNFSAQEVLDLTTNRTITYIPLSIHNVANDASGLGKTPEATILSFLCGLNALYADQDVQFFIHGTIFNRISVNIYNNASTTTSRNQMLSYRVSNTLNLIMGASINNQVASWYDSNGDFVFLLQSMLTPEAKTEGHEIGHFFTLPHTFNDWENQTVTTLYPSGKIPASCTVPYPWFGSFTPEKVPRTGPNANCTTAADGFCDTPADYFSDRLNCPFPIFRDCHDSLLNPDESNIMSYAYDACVTRFSTEQKNAIAMDIAARTWVTNTPASTLDVTATATAVSPLNNGQLGSITDPTVRLDWTDVPGATWYYLEVLGTKTPGLWLPDDTNVKFKGIIYSANSHYDLSTTGLVAGSRYVWRVKGVNSLSTCGPISTYSKFEAVTMATAIKDLPIEKQMSFVVNNNPITTSFIPFSVYTAEEVVASLRIYSMDGREVISMTKQVINQGDNLIQIPAENLSNGMYVAVLSSDRGLLQQKLVIQR